MPIGPQGRVILKIAPDRELTRSGAVRRRMTVMGAGVEGRGYPTSG
jgi:hypothetical protein